MTQAVHRSVVQLSISPVSWGLSVVQMPVSLAADPLQRPVSNRALYTAAYCASKSAIIGMTRSDAIDYSKDGIRVNCVCPGVIETPLVMAKAEIREAIAPAVEIAPMKRMGKPTEVADAALFLCSTQASFVQGHAMVVDGGYIIV